MATRTIANGGGNWNAVGTWVENAVPTSADDVVATGTSGQLTLNAAAACRSFDMTGYTNTLTHNTGITLTIGDGTAGAGNVALKLVAGMTYTPASARAITFASTSATQQTVTCGGKTLGAATFSGSGGSWKFNDAFACGALTQNAANTLDTNNQSASCTSYTGSSTGTLTLGSSAVACTGNWTVVAGQTLTANTATITFSGGTFSGGGKTYGTVVMTKNGAVTLADSNTFATLTRTGGASAGTNTLVLPAASSNQTIGTLNINGNSAGNRVFVQGADALGATRSTLTVSTAFNGSNADFQAVAFAGAASGDISGWSGGAGDALNNTGLTFTSAATSYWVGNGGNWSDAANHWASTSGGTPGTGRVPLPQDSVVFDASSFSSTGQTSTCDLRLNSRSIAMTSVANAPTISFAGTSGILSVTLLKGGGVAGSLVVLSGIATINCQLGSAIPVNLNYTSISNLTVTQGDAYAANSLGLGTNVGIKFQSPPSYVSAF